MFLLNISLNILAWILNQLTKCLCFMCTRPGCRHTFWTLFPYISSLPLLTFPNTAFRDGGGGGGGMHSVIMNMIYVQSVPVINTIIECWHETGWGWGSWNSYFPMPLNGSFWNMCTDFTFALCCKCKGEICFLEYSVCKLFIYCCNNMQRQCFQDRYWDSKGKSDFFDNLNCLVCASTETTQVHVSYILIMM